MPVPPAAFFSPVPWSSTHLTSCCFIAVWWLRNSFCCSGGWLRANASTSFHSGSWFFSFASVREFE
ncbi:hypothetical protein [Streptomyces tendae]